MNFYAKAFTFFAILSIVIFEEHSVLGDCGTKIISPLAACVYSVDGKCPHGMLRLDSDKKSYNRRGKLEDLDEKACGDYVKSYDAARKETPTLDPRMCCLLTSGFDIKVKGSPCTG